MNHVTAGAVKNIKNAVGNKLVVLEEVIMLKEGWEELARQQRRLSELRVSL